MKNITFMFLFTVCSGFLSAEWENITFSNARGISYASSELEKPCNLMEIGRYSPINLMDKDISTSWVEGETGSGTGSFVFLGTGTEIKKYIVIYNGYEQSMSLFTKNNRVKELKISLYTGFTTDLDENQFGFAADVKVYPETKNILLKDKMGPQVFTFPFNLDKIKEFRDTLTQKYLDDKKDDIRIKNSKLHIFYFLKFEIVSIYKGSKWDDTCISEISFSNRNPGEFVPLGEHIHNIYADEKNNRILVQTLEGSTVVLADGLKIASKFGVTGKGEFLTLDIQETDSKISWVILIYQHGFTGGGDIAVSYHLWSLDKFMEVPVSLMEAYGISSYSTFFFSNKDGFLYLMTDEGKKILLDNIELDMNQL